MLINFSLLFYYDMQYEGETNKHGFYHALLTLWDTFTMGHFHYGTFRYQSLSLKFVLPSLKS